MIALYPRAQRRQRTEQEALNDSRRADELPLTTKLAGKEGEREQLRHATGVGLAVVGEAVEVLDHQLEALRRPDVDEHTRLVFTDVPPIVHRARWNLYPLSRARDLIATIQVEPHGACENLESLGDVRMDVFSGDGPAGTDVEVDDEALAAGVLASLAHYRPVALDPVLVDLARSHVRPSLLESLTISVDHLTISASCQVTALPQRSRPRRQWPGTDNFGTLLRDPALAINELVSERLAERGFADFRPAHGTIAQHIADRGSRVTELAELAQVSKPTVVYLVNDLERLGYVERRPDPADGRAKLVCLTERGARAQAEARKIVAEIEKDWSRALGRQELASLRALLVRLHDLLWPSADGER